jgi:hypothetical protein
MDGGMIDDLEVRVLFDLGESLLCQLFVHCPPDILIDQLIL